MAKKDNSDLQIKELENWSQMERLKSDVIGRLQASKKEITGTLNSLGERYAAIRWMNPRDN